MVILSAGLTPALQKILTFDGFRIGEVNRAQEALWRASGKAINAGLAAQRLGVSTRILSPFGGDSGRRMVEELRELQADCRWIETEAATRVCTTIIDRRQGFVTELVENGLPMSRDELNGFSDAFFEEARGANVVIFTGSLPENASAEYYEELIAKTQGRTVLDFRGEGLLKTLKHRPFVVKPNLEELRQTLGKTLDTEERALAGMREIVSRGAEWIVVTQGEKPTYVVSANEAYRVYPPEVEEVVNPIGCGDALAAGIACGLHEGRSVLEAVQLGTAAAADNIRRIDAGRIDGAAVRRSASYVHAERIQ